jgi:hypothetical protein
MFKVKLVRQAYRLDSLPIHQLHLPEFQVIRETICDCADNLSDSKFVLFNFTSPTGMKGWSLKIGGVIKRRHHH